MRLLSPKVQGKQCLSFMYHMYGGTMGSVVIYMKTKNSETVQWITSGSHPDHWFEAMTFLNSSFEYQVMFKRKSCSNSVIQEYNSKRELHCAFYLLDRSKKVLFP